MNENIRDSAPSLMLRASRGELTPFATVRESRWVGGDFSTIPAASAFGVLVRLVRLNALEPRNLFGSFGLRLPRSDDLSEVMTFSDARKVAFAKAIGFAEVPKEWDLTSWLPFRSEMPTLRDPWIFRYCPMCLRTGYHTLLHQLPWFNTCPWHACALRTGCFKCGAPVATMADWALDANLRCNACKHDLLETEQAIEGATQEPVRARLFLERYLTWTEAQQAKAVLLIPDTPSNSYAALASLVEGQLWTHETSCRVRQTDADDKPVAATAAIDAQESLRRLDVLRQDRPGFLIIPDFMQHSLATVACNLALKLPPHVLTSKEMHLFLSGLGIEIPDTFLPANREASGNICLLPLTGVAERHYLNLTCMHPSSYRAVIRLIDLVVDNSLTEGCRGQISTREAAVLLRASQGQLCRGYAEGMRCALSRYVPELFRMARDRPHLTEPWILARFEDGDLSAVRVVRRPISPGSFGEADILEQADAANRRRQEASRKKRASRRT